MATTRMPRRLYVGNLAYDVTEDDLRGLFAEAGAVLTATIGLGDGNSSARGFGYVEMATEDEATRATEALHGRELRGRRLNIKAAPEEGDRRRGLRSPRAMVRRAP